MHVYSTPRPNVRLWLTPHLSRAWLLWGFERTGGGLSRAPGLRQHNTYTRSTPMGLLTLLMGSSPLAAAGGMGTPTHTSGSSLRGGVSALAACQLRTPGASFDLSQIMGNE